MKVDFIGYGIANRMKGVIVMNKKLLREEYEPLYHELYSHELEHSDGEWTFRDFLIDTRGFKNRKLWWKFFITTPSSWIQLSPVFPYNKKLYFDINLLVTWIFGILMCVVIIVGSVS